MSEPGQPELAKPPVEPVKERPRDYETQLARALDETAIIKKRIIGQARTAFNHPEKKIVDEDVTRDITVDDLRAKIAELREAEEAGKLTNATSIGVRRALEDDAQEIADQNSPEQDKAELDESRLYALLRKLEDRAREAGYDEYDISPSFERSNNDSLLLGQLEDARSQLKEVRGIMETEQARRRDPEREERKIQRSLEEEKETVFRSFANEEIGKIKNMYQEILGQAIGDWDLLEDLGTTYIAKVIEPFLDEHLKDGGVSQETSDAVRETLAKVYREKIPPEKRRDLFTEIVELPGLYDLRDPFRSISDGVVDFDVINRIISGQCLDEVREVVNVGVGDQYSRSIYNILNLNDYFESVPRFRTDRKDFLTIYRDSFILDPHTHDSPREDLRLWDIVRSSPKARTAFGTIIDKVDRANRDVVLKRSLTDSEGPYIDGLRYYPTPEAVRNLVLLASADYREYRTVHANWTLSYLIDQSDWPELLNQTIAQYPEMEEARGILTDFHEPAYGSNSFIRDAAGKFTLALARSPEAETIPRDLLLESLSVEGVAALAQERSIITPTTEGKIKKAFRVVNTIDEKDASHFLSYGFDAAVRKAIVDRLKSDSSETNIDLIDKYVGLLSQFEDKTRVLEYFATDKINSLFMHVTGESLYGHFADVNKALALVDTLDLSHVDPEGNLQESLIGPLVRINPASAYRAAGFDPGLSLGLTNEQILGFGESDVITRAILPQFFAEFYKRFPKSIGTPTEQILLDEANRVYATIANLRGFGFEKDVQRIIEGGKHSKQDELDILFGIEALQEFPEFDIATEISSFHKPEDVKNAFVNHLGKLMNLDFELTPEHADNFFRIVHNPTPFIVYAAKFQDRNEHVEVLKGLIESLMRNSYGDWRFGLERLDETKDKKLLPQNLTREQMQRWINDDQTEATENLTVEAQGVISAIQRVVYENREHFRVDKDGIALDLDEKIDVVGERLRLIGPEIGTVQKELGELKKDPKTNTENIADLEKRLEELRLDQKKDSFHSDVLRLLHLRPEEIGSGYVMSKDLSKKTLRLTQLLEKVKGALPTEDRFVIEYIETYLREFSLQYGDSQSFLVEDTADPSVILQIGKTPVGTCQNYENPAGLNDCLLGYFDPNTKILVLKSGQGKPMARSVFRILTDDRENPALHLETIYSASSSPAIKKMLLQHALKKAQTMGLPLYISHHSQNEGGAMVPTSAPDGIIFEKSRNKLRSSASRAPYVYADSGHGRSPNGQYEVEGLYRIRPSNDAFGS